MDPCTREYAPDVLTSVPLLTGVAPCASDALWVTSCWGQGPRPTIPQPRLLTPGEIHQRQGADAGHGRLAGVPWKTGKTAEPERPLRFRDSGE